VRAVRVVVRGRVQGVGFRWYAREQARRADVAGWVRNAPDGTVEIAASGDDESIEQFIEAIRRGPPGARVEGLECVAAEVPLAGDRPFSIRH
jgi:acylphosphatase